MRGVFEEAVDVAVVALLHYHVQETTGGKPVATASYQEQVDSFDLALMKEKVDASKQLELLLQQ